MRDLRGSGGRKLPDIIAVRLRRPRGEYGRQGDEKEDGALGHVLRAGQERSTAPAPAPVSAPLSQVGTPLTSVISMPRERITMRFAPPGRS